MAQVLPAERDLRRVIGDGESVPDGEVEGLTDHDLVELYRGLVLLRTYDERSVVYHSQGRIGTYAIYWNHEAMQAGSVYALEEDEVELYQVVNRESVLEMQRAVEQVHVEESLGYYMLADPGFRSRVEAFIAAH